MAPMKVFRQYEPVTIFDDGDPIQILVKKMTPAESEAFDRLLARARSREADRLVIVRLPGEEQDRSPAFGMAQARIFEAADKLAALKADQTPDLAARVLLLAEALIEDVQVVESFVIPDAEIIRRRLAEMTDAQRQQYDVLRERDGQAAAAFISETLARFVRVVPGQLQMEDEATGNRTDVTTGEQFAQCYGSRAEILQQVVTAVREENLLSPAEKKAWRSRFGLRPSSNERDPTANGGSSAPIAPPAELTACATTEGVTPTAVSPSGQTGES